MFFFKQATFHTLQILRFKRYRLIAEEMPNQPTSDVTMSLMYPGGGRMSIVFVSLPPGDYQTKALHSSL
jgi:hypothetical protein